MSAGSAGASARAGQHPAGQTTQGPGPAHLGELSAVWQLGLACFSEDALPYAVLGQYLTGRKHTILTVWQGSGLAGFAALRLARERGRSIGVIVSLGVHPAHRGNGIGRALLRGAHRWCRQAGAERVQLDVAQDNVVAITLYRSEGYRVVGRLPHYYGVDRHGLCMERPASSRGRGGRFIEARPGQ